MRCYGQKDGHSLFLICLVVILLLWVVVPGLSGTYGHDMEESHQKGGIN